MVEPLRSLAAAVLAGGLGTRLRPLVADRPKVLAPVRGRPFLAYLFDQLVRAAVPEVVLLTGYGADQVQDFFGTTYRDMRLIYSTEPTPLGTAGALRRALPLLRGDTILLLNGDSSCDLDLDAFHCAHRAAGAGASLTLTRVPDVGRFGRVRLAPDGRVLGFEEKGQSRQPGWINAGVYLIERSWLAQLPLDQVLSLERDLLPNWVAAGQVHGFRGGRFIDIGTPESYREADAFFNTPQSPGVCEYTTPKSEPQRSELFTI
jgi:D-glycero-alpha-D-manno-heptose 1-phosphate guanylyltransferase